MPKLISEYHSASIWLEYYKLRYKIYAKIYGRLSAKAGIWHGKAMGAAFAKGFYENKRKGVTNLWRRN
jgi:hypothetical protein